MAITTSQNEQLNRKMARASGTVSAVLGFGGAVAILAGIFATPNISSSTLWQLAGLIVIAAVVGGMGVQLIRGQMLAQQLLLAAWLLVAAAAVVLGVATMLYGAPAWWASAAPVPIGAVVAAVLAVACIAAMLVGLASAGRTRLRYGTSVLVAVAAAIALVVVINLIAQQKDNYLRRDLESLGQYGLSERATKILRGLNEPVRLTIVYSSLDPNQQERRARVWDLLNDMKEVNTKVQVANAVTDSERAAVLGRIIEHTNQNAQAHLKLLNNFIAGGKALSDQLRQRQQEWEQMGGHSYLDNWGLTAQVATALGAIESAIKDAQTKVRKDMVDLPDYAKLADQVKGILTDANEQIMGMSGLLEQAAKVQELAAANTEAAGASMTESLKAAQAAVDILGADNSEPNDPEAVLKAFAAAAQKAGDQVAATTQKLDEIGGSENAGFVRESRAWLLDTGQAPVVIGGVAYSVSRSNISKAYAAQATNLSRLQQMAEGMAEGGKRETQAQAIKEFRKTAASVAKNIIQLNGAARTAVTKLATIDDATKQVFAEVAKGKYFEAVNQPLAALLDEAGKLPAIKAGTLATDLREENIVIVEAADKTEVVKFDDVWPPKARVAGPMGAEGSEERVFNGDSAITSRILSMTQKPFATVVMAYLDAGPQAGRMGAEAGVTPRQLNELRRRMEQANLKVETWDLNKDMPDDSNAPPTPKVLLVLPPPPPMPMMGGEDMQSAMFGPMHVEKVRNAINAGASAIFMAQYRFPSGMMPAMDRYGWNDYLAEWGIQAKTDFIVVPAERDESGEHYQLSLLRFSYLPLNTFTDQPIGRPLQGQRTLWYLLCPVAVTATLPDVEVQKVLGVPSSWTSTWATGNFRQIVRQIQAGQEITPFFSYKDPNADIPAPFDVVLAATRSATKAPATAPATGPAAHEGLPPARIVVMGMCASFIDGYMDERIFVPNEKGGLMTFDPPRANADLVINSAYWLCGAKDYIASGPVQMQPVRVIPQETYRMLWAACVVVLPMAMLVLGGLVLFVRRR